MGFDANAFEMGYEFREPPTYHLEFPSRWSMWRLARRTARSVRRRGPTSVTIPLTRPLDEETCYASVGYVTDQDRKDVGAYLEEFFGQRRLHVSALRLKFVRVVEPGSRAARSDYPANPYDLVEATLTVSAQAR